MAESTQWTQKEVLMLLHKLNLQEQSTKEISSKKASSHDSLSKEVGSSKKVFEKQQFFFFEILTIYFKFFFN